MISLPDIFLKTQQFTNPQTQKLDYNTFEMKIYNIILLAIRQVNSCKASILKVWSMDPQGCLWSIQEAHEIKTTFITLNCYLFCLFLS